MDTEEDSQDQDPETPQSSNNQGRSSRQNPSQNNRGRKKTAKQEVKDNKKKSDKELDKQEKDKQDPLTKEREKDKNIGHVPVAGGYAKAHRESQRGEKKAAVKTLIKQKIKRMIRKAATKAIKNAAKKAAMAALKNPYVLAAIVVILLVIVLIVFIMGGTAAADPDAPKLTITKTGPTEAQNGQELLYQITIAYPGTAQDIIITDRIPEGTEYVSSVPPAVFDSATKTASWSAKTILPLDVSGLLTNVNSTLTLTLKATKDNAHLINIAQGTVIGGSTGGGPVSGDIAKLLPNPPPADPPGSQTEKDKAINAIARNRAVYEVVSSKTGIPWQVFSGIHYREGGASPNGSLVSGRPIGGNEPDVKSCSNTAPRGIADGIAEPIAGGCGFSSLTDSGIYAGKLLKQKVNGNLNVFQDLVTALSRYNGGGNANCDKTPYTGCPKQFYGEDDTYVVHLFDDRHVPMYIVYCADHTKCSPPKKDSRPGAATVIKWAASIN